MDWIAQISGSAQVDCTEKIIPEHTETDACKPCKPNARPGDPVRAGATRTIPDGINGYSCGKCKGTTYRTSPEGYKMPDGELVDGFECVSCSSIFLLCGNKIADARHKENLLLTGKTAPKEQPRTNQVADKWLRAHHQELLAKGWTDAELYQRKPSKGIAWLRIWDRPGLAVTMSQDGSIVFWYVNEIGNPIAQTAFPRRG